MAASREMSEESKHNKFKVENSKNDEDMETFYLSLDVTKE
jgi:hypothetical protein